MISSTTIYGKTDEVYKTSSTKEHMLGTRLVLPDGRVYRYAKCGSANITIGRVIGTAAPVTTHYRDVVVNEARTTAEWDAGNLTVQVATTAIATASIVAAHKYDDGYLYVNDLAGQGQILQIKSHTAGTTAASTPTFTMYEDDLLTIGITTTSQVGFIANLYSNVRIHTGTTGGGIPLGVAHIAVTANTYFWMQTWGPCPVISGSELSLAGEAVRIVNSTGGDTGLTGVAGSIYAAGATKEFNTLKTIGYNPVVGFTLVPAVADADYALVFLTLAP